MHTETHNCKLQKLVLCLAVFPRTFSYSSALIFLLCYVSFHKAVANVERAIIKALEKQYGDILAPLKDSIPKRLGMQVQKITGRQSTALYSVPSQVSSDGVLIKNEKSSDDHIGSSLEKQYMNCNLLMLNILGRGCRI